MNINWKLRFCNKITLTAIIMASISLIYQILGIIGMVPSISESQIIELAGMVINLLVLLGIVTDPTTDGISDSPGALHYNEPKASE